MSQLGLLSDQQVDMIRGHRVVEHAQTVALLSFEQPIEPAAPIVTELEQELLLMTAVGDVPGMARQEMTIGAWHDRSSLNRSFWAQKGPIKAKYDRKIALFYIIYNSLPWSDPINTGIRFISSSTVSTDEKGYGLRA